MEIIVQRLVDERLYIGDWQQALTSSCLFYLSIDGVDCFCMPCVASMSTHSMRVVLKAEMWPTWEVELGAGSPCKFSTSLVFAVVLFSNTSTQICRVACFSSEVLNTRLLLIIQMRRWI
jgi:hypothetical protein